MGEVEGLGNLGSDGILGEKGLAMPGNWSRPGGKKGFRPGGISKLEAVVMGSPAIVCFIRLFEKDKGKDTDDVTVGVNDSLEGVGEAELGIAGADEDAGEAAMGVGDPLEGLLGC